MSKQSSNYTKQLILNDIAYLFDDIITKPLTELNLENDFEINTIQFCKNWLSNLQEFSINTSGSTGKPKTIRLTRNQMIKSAEMTAETFNLQKGDSILINLNTTYIAGIMMLVRGFHLDLKMTIIEASSNPLEKIRNKYFNFFAFVPLQLQTIIENNKSDLLQKAKAIIVGGVPISPYQEKLFIKLNLPVFSTYGMTETCTHIAIRKVGKSSFNALINVELSIDERNCLIIKSPTSIENKLITNDVVDLLSSSEFIWKGRIDNIINSGGIKIQVEELESKISNLLLNIKCQTKFIITSKSDSKLGDKIVLVSEEKLNESFLKDNLSPFEYPKEFLIIDKFPETETGKINRNKLPI